MNTPPPIRQRPIYQISMRALIVLVTTCCASFGLVWGWINRSIAQRDSVRLLQQDPSVEIRYDYQVNKDPVFNRLFSAQPSAIGQWLGIDYVHHVKRIRFMGQACVDALLKFPKLDHLVIGAGVENRDDWRKVCLLSRLTRLEIISRYTWENPQSSRTADNLFQSMNLGNNLAPLLEDLEQLPRLRFFNLDCQAVDLVLLQAIFRHPEIQELHLHFYGHNDAVGENPEVENVEFPKSLSIFELQLVQPTHDSNRLKNLFGALPNLRIFCLHASIHLDEPLDVDVLEAMSRLSQLNEIYFFAVDVRRIPESWSELPLKRLGIGFCQLDDQGLEAIRSMRQLEYLQLNHTAISDNGVEAILMAKQLKELSIIDTRVTDQGLLKLAESGNLRLIRLRDTKVTNAGVDAFKTANPKCELILE